MRSADRKGNERPGMKLIRFFFRTIPLQNSPPGVMIMTTAVEVKTPTGVPVAISIHSTRNEQCMEIAPVRNTMDSRLMRFLIR